LSPDLRLVSGSTHSRFQVVVLWVLIRAASQSVRTTIPLPASDQRPISTTFSHGLRSEGSYPF